MLRIDAPIKRDTFDVLKSDSFQKFSYRLLIISEMVFITLTEVIIDVFKTSFAVAGMPRRVHFARLKIFGGRSLGIAQQRPLCIRHAETKNSTRLENTQAFLKQVRNGVWVVEVLDAMLREDLFTAVRLEGKISAKIESQITARKDIHIQVSVLAMCARSQIQPGRG